MTAPTPDLISVVMSAYNAQDTVERALRSVLAQTHEQLEVVVVDDGSTDDTRAIIERLAAADPRVRLLDPAPNAGVSTSRNRALDAARGDWIAFLDSDDEYTEQRLATMLAAAGPEVDAVISGHTIVLPTGERRERRSLASGSMSGLDAALASLTDRITPFIWDKIYRASAIEGLRFAVDIHRAEDAIFAIQAHARCRRVVFVPDALNIYYVSAGSLTWGRVPPLAESDRAVQRFTEVAASLGGGRQAVPVTRLMTYMNSANLAQQRLAPAEYRVFARDVRKRITLRDLAVVLRRRPFVGAAATLLKLSPALYSRVYGRYAARAYGIG